MNFKEMMQEMMKKHLKTWIKKSDNYGHCSFFCGRCGTQTDKPYEVCPNCGEKMKYIEEQE